MSVYKNNIFNEKVHKVDYEPRCFWTQNVGEMDTAQYPLMTF